MSSAHVLIIQVVQKLTQSMKTNALDASFDLLCSPRHAIRFLCHLAVFPIRKQTSISSQETLMAVVASFH